MGLFANPLSHAGFPPNVTGTPQTQNASIRAATAAEVAAAVLTGVYISPATIGTTRPITATTITAMKITVTATGTNVPGTFISTAGTVDAIVAQGGSIKVPATSVSGATPIVNNVRTGQVSFTNAVAGTTAAALVMTNSFITSSSVILATVSCTTSGSQLVLLSIVPGSGTVTFNVDNLSSTATAANININFWIMN